MKLLTSAAFGAAALATALMGSAAPAEARTAFGVYVGGPGYYYSDYDYGYRYRCDDYWYRRNHPRRCGYYYDYDDYNYPSDYYYDDGYYDGYYPGVGFTFFGGGHHHFGHHGFHHGFGGHHMGHHHW
jgi:hypothetical protein